MITTRHIKSKDGTRITYEFTGDGPPLVVVWGALGVRASPFATAMRDELAKSFTVYTYDRRGRGDSGDSKPYAVEREIEDLRAMVDDVPNGPPFVWATSSGAALALEAAAAGVPMRMLAAHEPPYTPDVDRDYPRKVQALVDEGRNADAVKLFMRTVGVPAPSVFLMRFMSFWKLAVAAAPSLPYDAACMNGFSIPEERFARIEVPTVVLWGDKTPASLQTAAKRVADVVPGAKRRVLPKQNHGVKPEALRPALEACFNAPRL